MNPAKIKARARKYGLTEAEIETMLAGVCEICGVSGDLVIDHCHRAHKVRGALCPGCNTTVGYFERVDRLGLADKMLEYLRRVPSRGAVAPQKEKRPKGCVPGKPGVFWTGKGFESTCGVELCRKHRRRVG